MKKLSIDRIENGLAVCEDENGNVITLNKEELPEAAAEKDILIIDDNGNVSIDYPEKERRQKAIFDLQEQLFE